MKPDKINDDAELVRKLKNNDEDAMIILYQNYWRGLYISAFKILKDKEACEDIIQDLFIKIWNNRDSLNITSSVQGYLSASVRYEVYRKIREVKKHEPIINDLMEIVADLSVSDLLEYKELQTQISQVIDTLPEKCKEVYHLSRNELLSHKEISEKLSISPNTVRNHLTRALHQLRIGLTQIVLIILSFIFFR
ncbi:RNA polymerase sigma-70 factor [Mucilaginibacter sp. BJC16-A38]|uniref:RNA polymerase sigma factor n=1 Tax=Mucilaginibacter phenanthrenivorans TaxID=1234842 RepID=UPI0021572506|nr:RNA polymerase sigma-70 factor [Mucilaginibacter phenanthrenivorans]MCR8556719.1 RNA polymerase sigma-70 factor [Mucilaginibacter phenanthrenivorans]